MADTIKTPVTTAPAGSAPAGTTPAGSAPAGTAPTDTTSTPSDPGSQPEDTSSSAPCDQGDGSPSFMDGEGSSPGAVGPGEPIPPMNGGANKPTNKEYITGAALPPIPANVNYNAMASSIRLSHYYTLADFLKGTNIPLGGKSHAGSNWSAQQLVQNMRDLCVLCLDPIKHRWRNMSINSSLRNGKVVGGSSTSAHDVGWAVDMNFYQCGVNLQSQIQIAREIGHMGLPYDQLLFEYSPGRGCHTSWVHIGYRQPATRGGQRGHAQTFFNDKGIGNKGEFVPFPHG